MAASTSARALLAPLLALLAVAAPRAAGACTIDPCAEVAFDGAMGFGPARGRATGAFGFLGLRILAHATPAPAVSFAAGVDVQPIAELFEIGIPAHVEWIPLREVNPFSRGPLSHGALTLALYAGPRAIPVVLVGCLHPGGGPDPCNRGRGSALLGEAGVLLRSGRGMPGFGRERLEIGMGVLAGRVVPWHAGDAPVGVYFGGDLVFGVEF